MAKAAIKALLSPASARKRRKRTITSSETTQELAAELNDLDRFNQIYYVAALMFCERGYHATSMTDIAEAVGITKAGVYHFIPGGKQDLLFGIMSYGMDTLDQCVIEPVKAIVDAEERLRAIIKNHVRLITNGSNASGFNPVTIVVDEVASLSPTQQRKIFQRKRKYLDLIRQTLEERKAEGK
jgi:AcrR family transcriptional regulator